MKKILIANRGEIAARIQRTCHKLGIETVVVYSEADKELPYVKCATVAVHIGEAPAQKSYMNQDLILKTALENGADAIHPGYGFLSENGSFVKKVEEAGLTFIGPDAQVIKLMGDKVQARKTMQSANVPVVPGSEGALDTPERAAEAAASIGYPVMLKASAGGGGIGMQRCSDETALLKAFSSNQARAKAYFGSADMFIEKAIDNGRHIEVQVFGDRMGNVVHLFERDCSVQRRNQKVIEESPSPFISSLTREKMTDAAVKAAAYVNYENAGTVEFIVDEDENFYFLEMNTRLQVEHPVTETITGYDLVEWQLLVADGKPLPAKQNEIKATGHALEFRLYAEDPKTFLPSPGTLKTYRMKEENNVRVDTGFSEGNTVSPFYDPMIAKIIVSDSTREGALKRAELYFESASIDGIKTNLPLFDTLLKEGPFKEGNYTTKILQPN